MPQEAGADAALLVTPYYNKPTQEGLYLHHKAVAEAVDIPQILYNVPGRTACDMLPETAGRLSEIANIVGLKEATGDLARLPRLRELCGPDFLLYSGDDATGCEFMLRGGDGVISVTTNRRPASDGADVRRRRWPVTERRPWPSTPGSTRCITTCSCSPTPSRSNGRWPSWAGPGGDSPAADLADRGMPAPGARRRCVRPGLLA